VKVVTGPAWRWSLNGDNASINSGGWLQVPQLCGVKEGVRARSIDQKMCGGGAHHGLAVGGGTPAESGHGSLSSGGRRWARGKGGGGARSCVPQCFEASRAQREEKGQWRRQRVQEMEEKEGGPDPRATVAGNDLLPTGVGDGADSCPNRGGERHCCVHTGHGTGWWGSNPV
jgi:hypothetical protein